MHKGNAVSQDACERIKSQKCRHQDQDVLCCSGLGGLPIGTMMAADVLNLLLVSVENDNHGCAGPGDKNRKK